MLETFVHEDVEVIECVVQKVSEVRDISKVLVKVVLEVFKEHVTVVLEVSEVLVSVVHLSSRDAKQTTRAGEGERYRRRLHRQNGLSQNGYGLILILVLVLILIFKQINSTN